jgi:hypothetical protein
MTKPAPAFALQQLSDALTDVVDRAAPSIVAVHSTRSRCSGFVWRPGLIVTVDEALDDEGDITVVEGQAPDTIRTSRTAPSANAARAS